MESVWLARSHVKPVEVAPLNALDVIKLVLTHIYMEEFVTNHVQLKLLKMKSIKFVLAVLVDVKDAKLMIQNSVSGVHLHC
jgi:hypothetical protein